MIKLFRSIRQRLLKEGQTLNPTQHFGKYFKYAIGEIVLVVVGILIALQINNWNEDRKESAQIKKYMNGLIEALKEDIHYLEYTQTGNTFRTECIKYLLRLSTGETPKSIPKLKYSLSENYGQNSGPAIVWEDIWDGTIPTDYDRKFVEECFKRTSYGNVIVVNQSTLEEFKNTGLFSYIENEELKRKINKYYASMNWHFSDWREANYRGQIDEWEDFLRDQYQINYFDISDVEDPIGLIKNHKDLQLQLVDLAIDAGIRANDGGDIRLTAVELIKSIESELLKMQ